MSAIRLGVVDTFDAERGTGSVTADGERYAFHCTAIADGSRRVDPGTEVAFSLVAAHGGRVEAAEITKLSSQPHDAPR